MSDVKWSDLFPRTTGGKGGSFKSVVVKDSPYQVKPFERLIIDATNQAFVIDPSLLKEDDDAFEIVDAARAFSKNPITIKGDKINIQMAGDGNDLILDMIGAGNTWGFIFAATDLFVAYSPENTSGGSGGGNSGGGGSGSITVDSEFNPNSTNAIQNAVVAKYADANNTALTALQNKVNSLPSNPSDKPGLNFSPVTISFKALDVGDVKAPTQAEIDAAKPGDRNVDYGDWVKLLVPKYNGGFSNMAGHAHLKLPGAMSNANAVRIMRDAGENTVYVAGRATKIEEFEVFIDAPDDSPIFGTWGDFQGEMKSISLDSPHEYIELSPMNWEDGTKYWIITGSGFDDEDYEIIEGLADVQADPGEFVQMAANGTVTLPPLKGGAAPQKVIVSFVGITAAAGGFTPNGQVKIAVQDPVFGVFRNKAYSGAMMARDVTDLVLTHAGEWIEFSPTEKLDMWMIRGAAVTG